MVNLERRLQKSLLVGARKERLAPRVYAAMVDNLYGTLIGYAALAVASMVLAFLSFVDRPGLTSGLMLLAMTGVTVCRVVLMISYHRWKRRGGVLLKDVLRWESGYAVIGVAMMGIIGFICAYTVLAENSVLALIVSVVVVMGITGLIAGRNGSRPRIVKYQLATIFVPFVAALLINHSRESIVIAVLIVVYHFATMSSTRAVYVTLRNALINQAHNKELSRRIKRSADLFDTALNNMTSGLLLIDRDQRLVVANEGVKSAMGHDLIEGMMGRPTSEIYRELFKAYGTRKDEADRLVGTFRRIMELGGEDSLLLVDHQRARTFELRIKTIPDQGAVINVDDITEKQGKDEEIRRLAHNDVLSGLPNRFSLGKYVEERLPEATDEQRLIVMYLDLDRFKEVNDELGHAAGDRMLVEVSERLKSFRGRVDFISRIAGDEFVLVFEKVRDTKEIEVVAKAIIERVSRPYLIAGRPVTIGASAGLSVASDTAHDALELLRLADVALYEAKARGRGTAVWFARVMDDQARAHREMTAYLKEAIESDGLHLHYQPVVDFRSGQVVACEALSRWTHETLGHVPPNVFISLAEESDLIHKLGQWSLTRACLDAKDWNDPNIKVAVNISASQFKHGSIAETVLSVLRSTGLDASRLEIEITESVLADDLDAMKVELETLSKAGISIALDDFGTGFSSLAFVHKFPIDKVKLDRSFVVQLDEDPSAVSLIASIVQMTQTMRKKLVIEGVETADQLALIAGVQARFVQGYYFSRPLPQQQLLSYLAQGEAEDGAAIRRRA